VYVIISHDVDHLSGKEHWFTDLYYPKLWVRESINLLTRKISFKEWCGRLGGCFKKERNQIAGLMEFDLKNEIPSTFFFGMNSGLGMVYSPKIAEKYISLVKRSGLEVGIHGICYDSLSGIESEYNSFTSVCGFEPDGIRMHYVRYDSDTFNYLASTGYRYDSTEFDKETGWCVKNPYWIGDMVEFPVTLMDSYLPLNLEKAKRITLRVLNKAEESKVEFITILFHDLYFGKEYSVYRNWYEWLINLLKESDEYCFISFTDAIGKLKENDQI